MKNPLQIIRDAVKDKELSQQAMADALEQDQSLISKKLLGKAKWQPRDMPYIEELTKRKVTRKMLRPDIYQPESSNA